MLKKKNGEKKLLVQNRQLTDITQIKSFELKPIIILSLESIIDRYSTSTLSDIYGAIAYYLKNKDAVEAYLNQREELAESVKQRLEAIQPDLSQIRSRLLSQRNL